MFRYDVLMQRMREVEGRVTDAARREQIERLIHESVAAGTDRESSVESVSVVEDEGRAREIAGATKIWRDSRRQRGLALAAVSRRLKRGDTTALEDYPPPPVPDSDDPLIGEALPKYVGFVDAHPRTHNFRPREPRKELFHDSFRSMRLWEPRAAFRGGGVRDEERSRALAAAQAAIEPPLLPAVHEPTVHGRSAFIDRSKVVPRDRSRPDFRCTRHSVELFEDSHLWRDSVDASPPRRHPQRLWTPSPNGRAPDADGDPVDPLASPVRGVGLIRFTDKDAFASTSRAFSRGADRPRPSTAAPPLDSAPRPWASATGPIPTTIPHSAPEAVVSVSGRPVGPILPSSLPPRPSTSGVPVRRTGRLTHATRASTRDRTAARSGHLATSLLGEPHPSSPPYSRPAFRDVDHFAPPARGEEPQAWMHEDGFRRLARVEAAIPALDTLPTPLQMRSNHLRRLARRMRPTS